MAKKAFGMAMGMVALPIVISKEDNWFVAGSPSLGIATQGKTEEEVKQNMSSLVTEFFQDEDTEKPDLNAIMTLSTATIPVSLPVDIINGKTETIKTT